MKIKEITYASGRVKYVCTWREYDLSPLAVCNIFFIRVFLVLVLCDPDPGRLFILGFVSVLLPFSFITPQREEFINKEEAIRFRELHYTAEIKKQLTKEAVKEAARRQKLNRQIISKKTIE